MNNKTALHILLVLSMIWAGLSCMSYLMMGLMLPTFQDYYASHPGMMPEEFHTMMERMFEVPKSYYLVCSLLFALELAGAILMWNLRRSGFHSYTIARLLLLLLPLLFLGRGAMAFGDVMLALLFILVYYLLLRQLGVFGQKPTDSPESEE
ncbi:MAG: hypothetical protein IKP21_00065 [Bacteroidales bacterium]|nr:hypothetical protein [Bacteroidales bacterium]